MYGTYVYCTVRRARRPALSRVPPGLPGARPPVVLNVEDDVWMVAAEVPLERYGSAQLEAALKDLDWVAAIALAHEGVVEHLARMTGAVVIPMKLFTMFTSEERALRELRSRRRRLERVFDRIAGCEEWGVRVLRSPRRAPARSPRKPRSGAEFLAARKEARDDSQRAARAASKAADSAYLSLSALARDRRRRTGHTAGPSVPLLDAAFLVPARQRARFHAAAARIARDVEESGARMTLTGPWPPYNFVSADYLS